MSERFASNQKHVIPRYEMVENYSTGAYGYKYAILEVSEKPRFLSGSFDKDHMDRLLDILENGNGGL